MTFPSVTPRRFQPKPPSDTVGGCSKPPAMKA